jgi:hypothetical protein
MKMKIYTKKSLNESMINMKEIGGVSWGGINPYLGLTCSCVHQGTWFFSWLMCPPIDLLPLRK